MHNAAQWKFQIYQKKGVVGIKKIKTQTRVSLLGGMTGWKNLTSAKLSANASTIAAAEKNQGGSREKKRRETRKMQRT